MDPNFIFWQFFELEDPDFSLLDSLEWTNWAKEDNFPNNLLHNYPHNFTFDLID